jgi:hypothetical protein
MRLTPLNLWIFKKNSIKKICKFFKPLQVLNHQFFGFLPVCGQFSGSMTGLCVGQFCGQLGPVAGLVPGPTG